MVKIDHAMLQAEMKVSKGRRVGKNTRLIDRIPKLSPDKEDSGPCYFLQSKLLEKSPTCVPAQKKYESRYSFSQS